MEFLDNYKIELLNEIGINPLWKWKNPYNEQNIYSIFQQNSQKNSQQISPKISNENSNKISNDNKISEIIISKIENTEKIENIENIENKENNFSYSWETLNKNIHNCQNCNLHKTNHNYVVGIGNQNADWLFVGEAPGEEEDKIGEPFVGDSGKLLDNMLQHLQLSRYQNIYIANTVKCRPPYNREPTDAEMNNCQDFLLQQIGLIQPKIIVCLGKVAFYALFKTQLNLPKSCSVSRYRKKMFNLSYQYKKQQYKIPTFITYHPSYLLRSPVQKVETWKDLCLAKHFYDTQITKNKN